MNGAQKKHTLLYKSHLKSFPAFVPNQTVASVSIHQAGGGMSLVQQAFIPFRIIFKYINTRPSQKYSYAMSNETSRKPPRFSQSMWPMPFLTWLRVRWHGRWWQRIHWQKYFRWRSHWRKQKVCGRQPKGLPCSSWRWQLGFRCYGVVDQTWLPSCRWRGRRR